jgi:GAF domain-containing protein
MSDNSNLKRLNILLKTTRKINQELAISDDEKKLCQKICRYLMQIKGYKFAWMGFNEVGNDKFRPIVITGKDKDFIKNIKNTWKEYKFNSDPTSFALKNGASFVIKDLVHEERFVPWDKTAMVGGFLSATVLPIKYYNDVIGTLHIYSDIKNYFIKEELSFLKEVACDISIGIKNIRNERKLTESKREYQELFKRISSCVAIYETKDNGNDFIIKDFNQAAEKTEKVKKEEYYRQKCFKRISRR